METTFEQYVDALGPEQRALLDRLHRLIREVAPQVLTGIAYKMPSFSVSEKTLYVGAWSHGLSVYGWSTGQDAGFEARHPELSSGKGTLRLTPAAMAEIDDAELRAFLAVALKGS